jgi:hypothetical protein
VDEPRSELVLCDPERVQLGAFLDDNRDELLAVLDSLTEEQARRRLAPSATSPLAIVKHAIFVEQVWFHVAIAGMRRTDLGLPDDADDSWILDADDSIASVRAEYATTRCTADRIAAGFELDDLAVHNRRGPLTVRWIYLHMIEELARHAGHGDILREQILAGGPPSLSPPPTPTDTPR